MTKVKKRKRVLLITGPGFEDAEVIYPYYRLLEEGFEVEVATSSDSEVIGKHGVPFRPTIKLANLRHLDFDGVIIPGGHEAPDRVRQVTAVLDFVRRMSQRDKIVAATCHGPWVLISSGVVAGKNATCYEGMKDDLVNAGAHYKKAPVVVDGNLITSDHPRNLGAWMRQVVFSLAQ